MKTSRKSVFHLHVAYILARLDIMMIYTSFFRFWKNIEFGLKTQVR
jgi:hypothetical protein